MEAQPNTHHDVEVSPVRIDHSETATTSPQSIEGSEVSSPEREITFAKLHERYMYFGEQDTPELRAFIQQEVDNEDRLWQENPELAARRDQYRREFRAAAMGHQSPEDK